MHVHCGDGATFKMSVSVLNTILPFHVIINSTGQIIQAGNSITSLFMDESDESIYGKNISEIFDILHQNQPLSKSAFLGTGEVVRLQCRSSKRVFCGNAYLLDSNITVESLHAKIILTLAKPIIDTFPAVTNGDCVAAEKENSPYNSQISSLENDLLVVKESLRKKRMFVRYVSHEIRTPLNVALLGLKCMEEELLPSFLMNSPRNSFSFDTHESPRPSMKTGELLDLVEDVKLSCNLAVELLNDLLLYEKIDDGLSGLSITSKFSLRAFLREIEKSFRMQSKGAGINLQFQYENGPQDMLVDIDKMKVQQVLRNLFTNAMKFTPSGGTVTIASHMLGALPSAEDEGITFADCFPSPTLESESNEDVATKEDKNKLVQYVRISLHDTGCGISKADQEALFHQFAQVRADQLQQGQGSGLGLWIAAKIVSLHHGRIGVTSSGEGSGATFVVDFPITGFATVSMPNILAELPPLVIPQNPLSMLSLSNDDGNNTTELPHFAVPVETRPAKEVLGSPMAIANTVAEAETVPVTAGITTASLASHMSFHRRIAENMIRTSSGLTAGSVGAPYSLALSSSSSASCVSTLTAPSICLSLGCSITSSPMAAQPNSSRYNSRRSTPTGAGPGFFAQQSARSTPTGTGPGFFSQQSARSTPTGTGPGFFSSVNSHKSQSLHHSQSTAAMIHSYTAQMRMLIVDDAPSNRKMVRRLMRDRFQRIDEAENGLQAVNLHAEAFASASQGNERAGYQVIMMDFTMPVMNGLEATRQIKARDPDVWVVGVTGAGHDEEIAAFMDAGADLVLLKPLNVHHFENFLLDKLRQKVAATAATTTTTNIVPASLGTPTSFRTNTSSSFASSSDVSVMSCPSQTRLEDSAAVAEPSNPSFSTSTRTTTEGSVVIEDEGYSQYVTSTTNSEKLSNAAVQALTDDSVEQQQCSQEEVDEVKNVTPVPPLSVKPPSHRPSSSNSNIQ